MVPDGARIVVPPGPTAPTLLLDALGRRRWTHPTHLFCGAGRLPASVIENENIRIFDWQFSGAARELYQAGRIDYVPLRYSDFPRAFGPDGTLVADVLFMQVPPMDSAGHVSPGLCGAIGFDIVKDVPLCIAETNAALPFTRSTEEINASDVDIAVCVEEPLQSLPRSAATAEEDAVAANVASLVADGATLQFGTGSVVEAVLARLKNHKHLGIHSGMVTEGILPLLESGAIDNASKGLFNGRTVAGMVAGSDRMLRFIDNNAEFLVVPAKVSHGQDTIARLQRFTTINSAIEVDLTGQVNAESIRGAQFSGVGGQADYTFTGSTSRMPGCKAIIAMPSTTAHGAVSRIVRQLAPGSIVTTPRYCVDFVVTEYGIADLRFQPLRERAQRLIAIAHPDHRAALEEQVHSGPQTR